MKNKHKLFESYRISDYPGFNEKHKLFESIQNVRLYYSMNRIRIEYQMKNKHKLFESYSQITQDSIKNKHKLFESYRISDYPGFNEKQTQTIRIV